MIVSGCVFSPPSSAGSGRSGGAPLPIEVAAVTPVPPAEPTVIEPVTTMQILDPIWVTNFEEVG